MGGVAALLILLFLGLCFLRRRRRQKDTSTKNMFGVPNKSSGIFDRSRRNTPASMDLLGATGDETRDRPSQEYLHNANDDSPGSYEPQPYLGAYNFAPAAPTSSGIPGTRTSHDSAQMSETTTGRSGANRQSFGMADFGNLASSEGNRMSSMGGSVTTGSPQLPAGPLPIASMYASPTSQSSPVMGSAGGPVRSNSTRKRRPATGLGPDGRPATRFVLHQDAGEIEDAGPEDEGDVV